MGLDVHRKSIPRERTGHCKLAVRKWLCARECLAAALPFGDCKIHLILVVVVIIIHEVVILRIISAQAALSGIRPQLHKL